MYKFKNIDSFKPLYYEKQGMLKFKLWFENRAKFLESKNRFERGLFKPRRKEFGRSFDLFCGNHYGEFVGSLLAKKIGMEACRVELVNVNTEKNKYTKGDIKFKEGAISYSDLKRSEEPISGKIAIERFKDGRPEEYERLVANSILHGASKENHNNIEVILAAIEYLFTKEGKSKEEIDKAKDYMIQMCIYDLAFGNNDRHDENWGMARDIKLKSLRMYPAYDNERVLGLYENLEVIKASVSRGDIEKTSREILTSRIGTPENPNMIDYEELLKYLAEKYPEQSLKYMKSIVDNVSVEDVNDILSSLEGLPKEYIEFGTKMYQERHLKNI